MRNEDVAIVVCGPAGDRPAIESGVHLCDECSVPVWVSPGTLKDVELQMPGKPKRFICVGCFNPPPGGIRPYHVLGPNRTREFLQHYGLLKKDDQSGDKKTPDEGQQH